MGAEITSDEAKKLKEKLFHRPKPVWDRLSEGEREETHSLGERYKRFLTRAKTEREAVEEIVAFARDKGFVDMDAAPGNGAGLFAVNKRKSVILAVPGTEPPEAGMRIIGSHVDCPRLDLKQNPLYEDTHLAYLKTHYYGGIKKYQWVARPLALHGKVVLKDGSERDVALGEEPDEPVFMVNDLLPHLAKKVQYEKKLPDIVVGEKLNILVGSLPYPCEDVDERVKLAVMAHLHEKFGLTERDLATAELEAVPAGPARDVGFDRSMVGGYGQDDRCSAFASLEALCAVKRPRFTSIALFVDKEEIGSEGATGAKGVFLEQVTARLFELAGRDPRHALIRRALASSRALSADVGAALDPDWQEVYEKRNACLMGHGVCLTKFTGSGGKSGANDADAEYLGWVCRVMEDAGVSWQTGELGKVDEGGGGTIAKLLAEYGMDVVDIGPPVLSMHSPFELSHKADVFMTSRAFRAFYEAR